MREYSGATILRDGTINGDRSEMLIKMCRDKGFQEIYGNRN
jgi:hypothetical protein